MKARIEAVKHRIENDPKMQEAIGRIKPKRTFWGIAGIVLFFFVPELITYIWQPELVAWAHLHSITEPLALQRTLYTQFEKMFADGVSWLNIGIGVLLLVWVWRSK